MGRYAAADNLGSSYQSFGQCGKAAKLIEKQLCFHTENGMAYCKILQDY